MIILLNTLFLLGLGTQVAPPAAASCPPNQVFSGTRCEYRNICPDGRILREGDRCQPSAPSKKPPSPPPAVLPPLQRDCISRLETNSGPIGSVILSGGNAATLFEGYGKLLSEKKIKRDLASMKVVFLEKGKRAQLTLTRSLVDIMRGDTIETSWSRRLRSHQAERVGNANQVARQEKSDLFCGD